MNLELIKKLESAGIVEVCRYENWRFGQDHVREKESLSESDGGIISYGDCRNVYTDAEELNPEEDILVIKLTVYSDYAGSLVEKSNLQFLTKQCERSEDKRFYKVQGGFGTKGLAIAVDYADPNVWETLEGLIDYPLCSEEIQQELQFEAEEAAYKDWAKGDFISCIGELFPAYNLDNVPDYEISDLFNFCMEERNEYWINEESDSVWIDLKDMVKAITETKLQELEGIEFDAEYTSERLEELGQTVLEI